MVDKAFKARRYRPLLIVDLSVPRAVDPRVRAFENVYLKDIDDIGALVALNTATRIGEATRAEAIIETELAHFVRVARGREAMPVLAELRRRGDAVARAEIQKTLQQLGPDLTGRQRGSVEAMAQAIVNKLLHEPTAQLREAAERGGDSSLAQLTAELFGLPEGELERASRRFGRKRRTHEPAAHWGRAAAPSRSRQSRHVAALIQAHAPTLSIELVEMTTQGDRFLSTPLAEIGGKGLFVREIEEALLRGEIDLAVHSLKDLPGRLPEGLALADPPIREDPRDALVARAGQTLRQLRLGARVGTSSLRRALQLRALRPDLNICSVCAWQCPHSHCSRLGRRSTGAGRIGRAREVRSIGGSSPGGGRPESPLAEGQDHRAVR